MDFHRKNLIAKIQELSNGNPHESCRYDFQKGHSNIYAGVERNNGIEIVRVVSVHTINNTALGVLDNGRGVFGFGGRYDGQEFPLDINAVSLAIELEKEPALIDGIPLTLLLYRSLSKIIIGMQKV